MVRYQHESKMILLVFICFSLQYVGNCCIDQAMSVDVSYFQEIDQQLEKSVPTATGSGVAVFYTSKGMLMELKAIKEPSLPTLGKPKLEFPHGFFSFRVAEIDPGEEVAVTITLPSPVPANTQYWQCSMNNEAWTNVTSLLGHNDGDNILILNLMDGGFGDADGVTDGVISQRGGPGVLPSPPAETIIVTEKVTIVSVSTYTMPSKIFSKPIHWVPVASTAVLVAIVLILLHKKPPVQYVRKKASIVSDIGGRQSNEDAALVINAMSSFRSDLRNRSFLMVADGMGGYQSGELASALCIKEINSYVEPFLNSGRDVRFDDVLAQAIKVANRKIFEMSDKEVRDSMGTTIVAAVVDGSSLHIAWVGDSRAYLFGAAGSQQLTRDHSRVQELVDRGVITLYQALGHPERHIITRSVGRSQTVEPDYIQVTLPPNGFIMLCTDGLSDVLTISEMVPIFNLYSSAEEISHTLVSCAKRKGATDNITVVIYPI